MAGGFLFSSATSANAGPLVASVSRSGGSWLVVVHDADDSHRLLVTRKAGGYCVSAIVADDAPTGAGDPGSSDPPPSAPTS